MADIEKATRPEPTEVPGAWRVRLDEQWCIGEKLHGGYLLAVVARAAVAGLAADTSAGHDTPQGVTATFLAAPEPGPCDVAVEVLRAGRGASQVRTRLSQGERACVEAVVVLGAARDAEAVVAVPPEPVAPWSECWRTPTETDDGRGRLPIMEVVDTRLDPSTAGFREKRPAGLGRFAGWAEQADGQSWTVTSLLVALDILPPASFDLGLAGWSPTMTFAAALHGEPAPGPVRVVQWVDHLAGDRMTESCRAWDADGRCVGQATQLAALRR